jgi:hypothetical protein
MDHSLKRPVDVLNRCLKLPTEDIKGNRGYSGEPSGFNRKLTVIHFPSIESHNNPCQTVDT